MLYTALSLYISPSLTPSLPPLLFLSPRPQIRRLEKKLLRVLSAFPPVCDHQLLVNHTGVANDPSFVLGRTDVRSKASRRGARVSTYMQSDAAAYASAALSFRVKGSTDKNTLAKLDERMLQIPSV